MYGYPPAKRKEWGNRAFTLIELLVVVAIVAILAALLLPALQNAKERGKQALCMSHMHQIHVSLMLYSDDNDGFFPMMYWGAPNLWDGYGNTVSWDYTGTSWMTHYFPDPNILWCPGMDPRLTDPNVFWAAGYYKQRGVYCTTYYIMMATSDRVLTCPAEAANLNGWWTYGYPFTQADSYRAPCPNVKYAGTWVTPSPCYLYGQIWFPPAAEQAAVIDGFDPSGTWSAYNAGNPPRALNNHYRLGGENVVFLDGHGEWRSASQVKQRFPYYGANWIWW
jgi:prepilin-type N-terminal cleavage/methylation domain-containing protein